MTRQVAFTIFYIFLPRRDTSLTNLTYDLRDLTWAIRASATHSPKRGSR